MKRNFWGICGIFLYMEVIYHMASFQMQEMNPILFLPLILFVAGVQTMLCGIGRKKANKILFWCMMSVNYVLYASQLVYIHIFKQPLLLAAMLGAGTDALTDFWKEAFNGILNCGGYLALLALPLLIAGILIKVRVLVLRRYKKKEFVYLSVSTSIGLLMSVLILVTGYYNNWTLYEEYQGFYDPSKIVSEYGVLPVVERDLLGELLPMNASALDALAQDALVQEEEKKEPEYEANVLEIDFDKLDEAADSDRVRQLAAYLQNAPSSNQNAYTGMFKGYNLIYITAEGFSQYAVDETLTPTLYKLTHSGFVAEDYYVPIWQTSTSDGEYVNMFGLIPDGQLSFRRTQDNALPFSLPAYFAKEGVESFAYHNNSLTYYDRHLTHPNMGYLFKAAKLGKLTEAEGGDRIFAMENPEFWPASDLEMMKSTIPEYIGEERFHAYYMTVSGHLEYTFEANHMSKKNQELVEALPYSDEGKAYIACNIELDRALEYLIGELEKAGKLDNTVIALSSDHYPYGLEADKLEELAGKPLEGTLELYRNSLILWNAKMDTVKIEKTCSAMDLLPTVYNLFGFEYDSRLFAGKDMLSDRESLVVFADRSFITDQLIYNNETKEAVSRTEEPVNEEYLSQMKTLVQSLFEYSAGILNEDFYRYVEQAVTWKHAPLPEADALEEIEEPESITQAPEATEHAEPTTVPEVTLTVTPAPGEQMDPEDAVVTPEEFN